MITSDGIWFATGCVEYPLSYEDFPCFKGVPEEKVKYVIEPETDVYYWPELDVQLTLEQIWNPKKYPMKTK